MAWITRFAAFEKFYASAFCYTVVGGTIGNMMAYAEDSKTYSDFTDKLRRELTTDTMRSFGFAAVWPITWVMLTYDIVKTVSSNI